MHGRRGPTPCNVSRGLQHMMSCPVPSFRLAKVCGIYISATNRLVSIIHMLHLKAHSLQGAILYPLRHRADVEAKVGF